MIHYYWTNWIVFIDIRTEIRSDYISKKNIAIKKNRWKSKKAKKNAVNIYFTIVLWFAVYFESTWILDWEIGHCIAERVEIKKLNFKSINGA